MSLVVVVAACANAEPSSPDGAPPPMPDSRLADRCNTGELATAIAASGQVTCTPIDTAAGKAVDDNCSVYLGWRDGCDGCMTDPAKWGFAGGDRCTNGLGAGNTCTTQMLGGQPVRLFGLDPDGDVDGNDKLYTSLHCAVPAASTGATAPCPPGEFVTGTNGASVRCAPLAAAVVTYVREQCSLYVGWQDTCDGCVTEPVKWGQSGDSTCANGAGVDNSCTMPMLADQTVVLFGLNPDGDVDGNDKLHVGLRCGAAAPATSTTTTICPAGQFVVGTAMDGSFFCESAAPAITNYFADHCSIYFGWRDNCDGCTTPPTKWGTAKVGACANGAGADNTCTTFTLGGQTVALFGLSPDGDVDGNDALYVGLQCR